MKTSKDKLLESGIEKLRNFGFVNVNKNNVLKDEVYKYYLKRFLTFMLGQSDDLDVAIKDLFISIDKKKNENYKRTS